MVDTLFTMVNARGAVAGFTLQIDILDL